MERGASAVLRLRKLAIMLPAPNGAQNVLLRLVKMAKRQPLNCTFLLVDIT